MTGRILAVDPGEKRIGIALSDPAGSFASPLAVIKHLQLRKDAEAIYALVLEHEAVLIIIGQPLGGEGEETRGARHSARLADAIREFTAIPVILWDESHSTLDAKLAQVSLEKGRTKRRGHLDDRAAAMILQSYLDAQRDGTAAG